MSKSDQYTNDNSPVRVIFFGTPDFAVSSLQALISNPRYHVNLVITQPDKPAGRGKQQSSSPVKNLALSQAIPILQPESIRKHEVDFIEKVRQFGPFDVGVVVAFGQILPPALLQVPRFGCINVHASLLPRWRGAAPIQRAIMAGDKESGVALMQMEAGLDTGPVYVSSSVKITPEMNSGELHDRLAVCGSQLLAEKLIEITNATLSAIPQSTQGVTYAQKITNLEACIDWKDPAAKIERQVLALAPVPGAFTMLNNLRLKIFRVRQVAASRGLKVGSAGQVYFQDSRTFEVHSGDGILAIDEVQLEGKKRMQIADFLRGIASPISILG